MKWLSFFIMGKFLGFYTLCTKLTDNLSLPYLTSPAQMVNPLLYLILTAVK